MTLNKSFFYILILFILGSCKQDDAVPPKADFFVYNTFCIAPCEVYFFDNSVRAVSYLYDFGDGNTSTLAIDTNLYTLGGAYEVKLTVTAANGTTDTKIKNIWIGNPDTMSLSSLDLIQYKTVDPFFQPWDQAETLGDDFYIHIYQNGTLIYNSDTIPKSNVLPNQLPVNFNLDTLRLADAQVNYEIQLYDKDSLSTDDFLGSVNFTPGDYNNSVNPNPPTTILLENQSDSLQISLNVVWLGQ